MVAAEMKTMQCPSALMALPTLIALAEVPGLGVFATETRTVLGTHPLATPMQVSRTKMSSPAHAGNVSSGVRFVEIDPKDTNLPSVVMDTPVWLPGLPPPKQLPMEPSFPSETRLVAGVQPVVAAVHVSRT